MGACQCTPFCNPCVAQVYPHTMGDRRTLLLFNVPARSHSYKLLEEHKLYIGDIGEKGQGAGSCTPLLIYFRRAHSTFLTSPKPLLSYRATWNPLFLIPPIFALFLPLSLPPNL